MAYIQFIADLETLLDFEPIEIPAPETREEREWLSYHEQRPML